MISFSSFYGKRIQRDIQSYSQASMYAMDCDIDRNRDVILLPDADVSEPEIDSESESESDEIDESDCEEQESEDFFLIQPSQRPAIQKHTVGRERTMPKQLRSLSRIEIV